ncbi:hypothetical protein [Variovorax sp. GT1P44]|uniref:hypothetical protein n=1 Tax=Variovorax sp. GT1P44 TaxID=3443742 RepID=UPI003F44683F
MTTDLYETTRLSPGQTLRMAVDKGFTLFVEQGALNIVSPPSWFGDTVFTAKSMVMEGEAYVAEDGGWIEVAALSPAKVIGLPKPAAAAPAGPSLVARLVQLLVARTA